MGVLKILFLFTQILRKIVDFPPLLLLKILPSMRAASCGGVNRRLGSGLVEQDGLIDEIGVG